MRRLDRDKQARVIDSIVEGCSIRSTERLTGVHHDTIMRLCVRLGNACAQTMNEMMRWMTYKRIQVDELWCFVRKKARHVRRTDNPTRVGDFWTCVAFDADTKPVSTYVVGKRDRVHAETFIGDLAERLANRVQVSADGLGLYVDAIERAFGGKWTLGRS